ncbi:c-type cytochrome [Adhaeribacter rhizoryzae]|uniref:Cytochrome c n=1 Tax=Adhaeribacter rhizoryzae TaxID=2607907 RepID=A0A5M6D694_9BACT|nr:cytochrome c [Adhaeribacter rhizoryzae]KAA5543001.1 cytochrome c [Adhaeribacter rhizoryzae]
MRQTIFQYAITAISKWLLVLAVIFAACTRTNIHNQATGLTSAVEAKYSSHSSTIADTTHWPPTFGFGKLATTQELATLDIDIRPDGQGLPAGSGTVTAGKAIYASKCAACHGKTGVEGPNNRLVETAAERTENYKTKEKTIGNYWPYATTLFDYIRRAMPFNAPGSLTNDEVYALTAFLLHANNIIAPDAKINAQTLPQIIMPARQYFVTDDRKGGPEVR